MIGGPELWVIAGVLVVIFGAKKLPEIGKGVGEAIKNFKKSMSESHEDTTSVQRDGQKREEKKTD
jgi:sec-independent protein translocase protein TatA